jgi:competence protein ComEC
MGLILIFLPQPLSGGVSWLMNCILDLFIWSVDSGLQLPGASLRVPSPPSWMWILYAFAMTAVMWALRRQSRTGLIAAASLVSILTLAIALGDFSPPAPQHPTLTFIDVGQGDAALIELPDGKRVVVDGGGVVSGGYRSLREAGTFSIGENVVSAYLFSLGLRRLDAIALTHAHHDHMDGLFDLIRNFEIGEVWLGKNPAVPRYRELIQEIYQHNIPIRWLGAGDSIGPFRVLNPSQDQIPAPRVHNDDSLVLMLETGTARALLTGDLESDLEGLPDYVDVLKVPHHGSKNTR